MNSSKNKAPKKLLAIYLAVSMALTQAMPYGWAQQKPNEDPLLQGTGVSGSSTPEKPVDQQQSETSNKPVTTTVNSPIDATGVPQGALLKSTGDSSEPVVETIKSPADEQPVQDNQLKAMIADGAPLPVEHNMDPFAKYQGAVSQMRQKMADELGISVDSISYGIGGAGFIRPDASGDTVNIILTGPNEEQRFYLTDGSTIQGYACLECEKTDDPLSNEAVATPLGAGASMTETLKVEVDGTLGAVDKGTDGIYSLAITSPLGGATTVFVAGDDHVAEVLLPFYKGQDVQLEVVDSGLKKNDEPVWQVVKINGVPVDADGNGMIDERDRIVGGETVFYEARYIHDFIAAEKTDLTDAIRTGASLGGMESLPITGTVAKHDDGKYYLTLLPEDQAVCPRVEILINNPSEELMKMPDGELVTLKYGSLKVEKKADSDALVWQLDNPAISMDYRYQEQALKIFNSAEAHDIVLLREQYIQMMIAHEYYQDEVTFDFAAAEFSPDFASAMIVENLTAADLARLANLEVEVGIAVIKGKIVLFTSGNNDEIRVTPQAAPILENAELIAHSHLAGHSPEPSITDISAAGSAVEYVVNEKNVYGYKNGGSAQSYDFDYLAQQIASLHKPDAPSQETRNLLNQFIASIDEYNLNQQGELFRAAMVEGRLGEPIDGLGALQRRVFPLTMTDPDTGKLMEVLIDGADEVGQKLLPNYVGQNVRLEGNILELEGKQILQVTKINDKPVEQLLQDTQVSWSFEEFGEHIEVVTDQAFVDSNFQNGHVTMTMYYPEGIRSEVIELDVVNGNPLIADVQLFYSDGVTPGEEYIVNYSNAQFNENHEITGGDVSLMLMFPDNSAQVAVMHFEDSHPVTMELTEYSSEGATTAYKMIDLKKAKFTAPDKIDSGGVTETVWSDESMEVKQSEIVSIFQDAKVIKRITTSYNDDGSVKETVEEPYPTDYDNDLELLKELTVNFVIHSSDWRTNKDNARILGELKKLNQVVRYVPGGFEGERQFNLEALDSGIVTLTVTTDPCQGKPGCMAAVISKKIEIKIRKVDHPVEYLTMPVIDLGAAKDGSLIEYEVGPNGLILAIRLDQFSEIAATERLTPVVQAPLQLIQTYDEYPFPPGLVDAPSYRTYVFRSEGLPRKGVLIFSRDPKSIPEVREGETSADIPACQGDPGVTVCFNIETVSGPNAKPDVIRIFSGDAGKTVTLSSVAQQLLMVRLPFGGFTLPQYSKPYQLPADFKQGEIARHDLFLIEQVLKKDASRQAVINDLAGRLNADPSQITLRYQIDQTFQSGDVKAQWGFGLDWNQNPSDQGTIHNSFGGDFLYQVKVSASGEMEVTLTNPEAIEVISKEKAVTAVTDQLVSALGITDPNMIEQIKKDIIVTSAEKSSWTDGCRGWFVPREACSLSIVDGYKVVLSLYHNEYEFHAGRLDPAKDVALVAMNDLIVHGAAVSDISIVSSTLEQDSSQGANQVVFDVVLLTPNQQTTYRVDYWTHKILPKNPDVPPTSISVAAGDTFTIELVSNPSTGFKWQLASPLDPAKLLQIGESVFTADYPGRPGSPGKEVWTFKALEAGNANISLQYCRYWETVPPLQTANYNIIIGNPVIPPAVQNYVNDLQAKLGDGFKASVTTQSDGRYLVSVAPAPICDANGICHTEQGKSGLVKMTFILTVSDFGLAVSKIMASYLYDPKGVMNPDGQLLFAGMKLLDPKAGDKDALVLMTLLMVTQVEDNGTIHFKTVDGAAYKLHRDANDVPVLEKETMPGIVFTMSFADGNVSVENVLNPDGSIKTVVNVNAAGLTTSYQVSSYTQIQKLDTGWEISDWFSATGLKGETITLVEHEKTAAAYIDINGQMIYRNAPVTTGVLHGNTYLADISGDKKFAKITDAAGHEVNYQDVVILSYTLQSPEGLEMIFQYQDGPATQGFMPIYNVYGKKVQDDKPIPQPVQNYVNDLQAKLADGFKVSASFNAPTNEYLVQVQDIKQYFDFAIPKGPLSSMSVILSPEGTFKTVKQATYYQMPDLDGTLLFAGMGLLNSLLGINSDGLSAAMDQLVLMTLIMVTQVEDNGTIHFEEGGVSYKLYRNADGKPELKKEQAVTPFKVAVSTNNSGQKNLTVTVGENAHATIDWAGWPLEGEFDVTSSSITISFDSGWWGMKETLVFRFEANIETGAYSLTALNRSYDYSWGVKSIDTFSYAFSGDGLLQAEGFSHVFGEDYLDNWSRAYTYVNAENGNLLIASTVYSRYDRQPMADGTVLETKQDEKYFYDYDLASPWNERLMNVHVNEIYQNDALTESYADYQKTEKAPQETRYISVDFRGVEGLAAQVNSLADYAKIEALAHVKSINYSRNNYVYGQPSQFLIQYVREDLSAEFVARRVDVNGQTYIVQGAPDVLVSFQSDGNGQIAIAGVIYSVKKLDDGRFEFRSADQTMVSDAQGVVALGGKTYQTTSFDDWANGWPPKNIINVSPKDDILVQQYQRIQAGDKAYSVYYGNPDDLGSYYSPATKEFRYGLVLASYGAQSVIVDFPKDPTVTLDGIKYDVWIDKDGQVVLDRQMTIVYQTAFAGGRLAIEESVGPDLRKQTVALIQIAERCEPQGKCQGYRTLESFEVKDYIATTFPGGADPTTGQIRIPHTEVVIRTLDGRTVTVTAFEHNNTNDWYSVEQEGVQSNTAATFVVTDWYYWATSVSKFQKTGEELFNNEMKLSQMTNYIYDPKTGVQTEEWVRIPGDSTKINEKVARLTKKFTNNWGGYYNGTTTYEVRVDKGSTAPEDTIFDSVMTDYSAQTIKVGNAEFILSMRGKDKDGKLVEVKISKDDIQIINYPIKTSVCTDTSCSTYSKLDITIGDNGHAIINWGWQTLEGEFDIAKGTITISMGPEYYGKQTYTFALAQDAQGNYSLTSMTIDSDYGSGNTGKVVYDEFTSEGYLGRIQTTTDNANFTSVDTTRYTYTKNPQGELLIASAVKNLTESWKNADGTVKQKDVTDNKRYFIYDANGSMLSNIKVIEKTTDGKLAGALAYYFKTDFTDTQKLETSVTVTDVQGLVAQINVDNAYQVIDNAARVKEIAYSDLITYQPWPGVPASQSYQLKDTVQYAKDGTGVFIVRRAILADRSIRIVKGNLTQVPAVFDDSNSILYNPYQSWNPDPSSWEHNYSVIFGEVCDRSELITVGTGSDYSSYYRSLGYGLSFTKGSWGYSSPQKTVFIDFPNVTKITLDEGTFNVSFRDGNVMMEPEYVPTPVPAIDAKLDKIFGDGKLRFFGISKPEVSPNDPTEFTVRGQIVDQDENPVTDEIVVDYHMNAAGEITLSEDVFERMQVPQADRDALNAQLSLVPKAPVDLDFAVVKNPQGMGMGGEVVYDHLYRLEAVREGKMTLYYTVADGVNCHVGFNPGDTGCEPITTLKTLTVIVSQYKPLPADYMPQEGVVYLGLGETYDLVFQRGGSGVEVPRHDYQWLSVKEVQDIQRKERVKQTVLANVSSVLDESAADLEKQIQSITVSLLPDNQAQIDMTLAPGQMGDGRLIEVLGDGQRPGVLSYQVAIDSIPVNCEGLIGPCPPNIETYRILSAQMTWRDSSANVIMGLTADMTYTDDGKIQTVQWSSGPLCNAGEQCSRVVTRLLYQDSYVYNRDEDGQESIIITRGSMLIQEPVLDTQLDNPPVANEVAPSLIIAQPESVLTLKKYPDGKYHPVSMEENTWDPAGVYSHITTQFNYAVVRPDANMKAIVTLTDFVRSAGDQVISTTKLEGYGLAVVTVGDGYPTYLWYPSSEISSLGKLIDKVRSMEQDYAAVQRVKKAVISDLTQTYGIPSEDVANWIKDNQLTFYVTESSVLDSKEIHVAAQFGWEAAGKSYQATELDPLGRFVTTWLMNFTLVLRKPNFIWSTNNVQGVTAAGASSNDLGGQIWPSLRFPSAQYVVKSVNIPNYPVESSEKQAIYVTNPALDVTYDDSGKIQRAVYHGIVQDQGTVCVTYPCGTEEILKEVIINRVERSCVVHGDAIACTNVMPSLSATINYKHAEVTQRQVSFNLGQDPNVPYHAISRVQEFKRDADGNNVLAANDEFVYGLWNTDGSAKICADKGGCVPGDGLLQIIRTDAAGGKLSKIDIKGNVGTVRLPNGMKEDVRFDQQLEYLLFMARRFEEDNRDVKLQVSVATSPSDSSAGGKDLTITVDVKGHATITWGYSKLEGEFDEATGLIKIVTSDYYSGSQTYTFALKANDQGNYALVSLDKVSTPSSAYGWWGWGSTVTEHYEFSDAGLLAFKKVTTSRDGYSDVLSSQYAYDVTAKDANGNPLVTSLITSETEDSTVNGVAQKTQKDSKAFTTYDAKGNKLANVSVSENSVNGQFDSGSASYLQVQTTASERIETSASVSYVQGLLGQINGVQDFGVVEKAAFVKTAKHYDLGAYNPVYPKLTVQFARNAAGNFEARRVDTSDYKTYIVKGALGDPIVLTDANSILFSSYQQGFNGYSIQFGPVYGDVTHQINTNGYGKYLGYGLSFTKWDWSTGQSIAQIADFPNDPTVTLDGIKYDVWINKDGQVMLDRRMTIVYQTAFAGGRVAIEETTGPDLRKQTVALIQVAERCEPQGKCQGYRTLESFEVKDYIATTFPGGADPTTGQIRIPHTEVVIRTLDGRTVTVTAFEHNNTNDWYSVEQEGVQSNTAATFVVTDWYYWATSVSKFQKTGEELFNNEMKLSQMTNYIYDPKTGTQTEEWVRIPGDSTKINEKVARLTKKFTNNWGGYYNGTTTYEVRVDKGSTAPEDTIFDSVLTDYSAQTIQVGNAEFILSMRGKDKDGKLVEVKISKDDIRIVNYPIKTSVCTDTACSSYSKLDITIGDNGHAIIIWQGRTLEGEFDIAKGTITIQTNEGYSGTKTYTFALAQDVQGNYSLTSITIASDYGWGRTGTDVYDKFTSEGYLGRLQKTTDNSGFKSVTTAQYGYTRNAQGMPLVTSEEMSLAETWKNADGTAKQTDITGVKKYHTYDANNVALSNVEVMEKTSDGKSVGAYAYFFKTDLTKTQKLETTVIVTDVQGLLAQISADNAFQVIEKATPMKQVVYYDLSSWPGYPASQYYQFKYRVQFERNDAGQFIVRLADMLDGSGKVRIVLGSLTEPPPAFDDSNSIAFNLWQYWNPDPSSWNHNYSVNFGQVIDRNGGVGPIWDGTGYINYNHVLGYGLSFERYDYTTSQYTAKFIDFPNVTRITLDEGTYDVSFRDGKLVMDRAISPEEYAQVSRLVKIMPDLIAKKFGIDVNGDGYIDGQDSQKVFDTYAIAMKYPQDIPAEMAAVLDLNGDKTVSELDQQIATQLAEDNVSDYQMVQWVNGPKFNFDFDGDGKLTTADYPIFKRFDGQSGDNNLRKYLTPEALAKLDLNHDKGVDPKDVVLFGEILNNRDTAIKAHDAVMAINTNPDQDYDGELTAKDLDLLKAGADQAFTLGDQLKELVGYFYDLHTAPELVDPILAQVENYVNDTGKVRAEIDQSILIVQAAIENRHKVAQLVDGVRILFMSGVSEEELRRADIDGDGGITAADLDLLTQGINAQSIVYVSDSAAGKIVVEGMSYGVTKRADGVFEFRAGDKIYVSRTDSAYVLVNLNEMGYLITGGGKGEIRLQPEAVRYAVDVDGDGAVNQRDVAREMDIFAITHQLRGDMNFDAKVNSDDLATAKDEYEIAIKLGKTLPEEWRNILDVDHNGAVNQADEAQAVDKIQAILDQQKQDVSIANNLASFVKQYTGNGDLNEDGVADDKDLALANNYAIALKVLPYLSPEVVKILDYNHDGVVDQADGAKLYNEIKTIMNQPVNVPFGKDAQVVIEKSADQNGQEILTAKIQAGGSTVETFDVAAYDNSQKGKLLVTTKKGESLAFDLAAGTYSKNENVSSVGKYPALAKETVAKLFSNSTGSFFRTLSETLTASNKPTPVQRIVHVYKDDGSLVFERLINLYDQNLTMTRFSGFTTIRVGKKSVTGRSQDFQISYEDSSGLLQSILKNGVLIAQLFQRFYW